MAVRWQAETPPDPQLLVLNEPLAAELGLDAVWLRSADGLRFLVGQPATERCRTGGSGLCRASVRQLRAAAGRRAGVAAGGTLRRQRSRSRPAPERFRVNAFRAWRRRPGRGGTDAARVHRQRSDARAGHPDHPIPCRAEHRAPGLPRDAVARRIARSGREQSSAGGELSIRRVHRGRRPGAPPRRPRDRPPLSQARRTPSGPTWRCSKRWPASRQR